MTKLFTTCFAVLLIYLVLANSGSALQCYQCDGDSKSACGLPQTTDEFLKDCPAEVDGVKPNSCIKRKHVYQVAPQFVVMHVERVCGTSDAKDEHPCYEMETEVANATSNYCACSVDKCNKD